MKLEKTVVNSYRLFFSKVTGEEINVTITKDSFSSVWEMKSNVTLKLIEIAGICKKIYENTSIGEDSILVLRKDQPGIYVYGPNAIKEDLLNQVEVTPPY